MKRYEGFVRGTGSAGRNPPRWLVVAAQLQPTIMRHGDVIRASALGRWQARLLRCSGSRCSCLSCHSGTAAGTFWQLLDELASSRAPLWIMSPRALLAWQTLELWRLLESGNIVIAPDRWDRQNPVHSRSYGRTAGMLMVDDPPSAIRFRLVDRPALITWVCAGNYGLQPLSPGCDADRESYELAGSIAAVNVVLEQHHLGTWSVTAGAMALKGWRATYDGPALYVSTGPSGDALEQSAVAGGVLSARHTGSVGVTAVAVDARSMYGHIAVHYPQPCALLHRDVSGALAQEAVKDHALSCLADVTVRAEQPQWPQRSGGTVSYPIGEFRTALCGPELQAAQRAGAVLRVHRCNVYRLGTPLAEYERRVWSARRTCESASLRSAGPLIKRLGVSLIGKFIQRIEHWQECVPGINDPLWGSWVDFSMDGVPRRFRARGGIVECAARAELAAHAIPSIPLWVWSWGRLRMFHWMEVAGREEVYYADTDGLILSPLGMERLERRGLIYDDSWGMLRIVAGPCRCCVYGPKHFVLGDRVVHAGRPVAARAESGTVEESAWYRLPWDAMSAPEWSGSWVEGVR